MIHPKISTWPFLVALAMLGLWEFACRYWNLPAFILPPPSQILATSVIEFPLLMRHCLSTAAECLLGIVFALLIGVPLAAGMFLLPGLEKAVAPFLVASQSVPVFALAPLLVIWFGYGMSSKVLMAALVIFFPITISLLDGLKSCDKDYQALFRLIGAGKWQTFRLLNWPWALPQFFSGLKVGVSVAAIGAVIGEWVGSQQGLGYLMIQANARMKTDRVFAAILYLTVLGLFFWKTVNALEQHFVYWKKDKNAGF